MRMPGRSTSAMACIRRASRHQVGGFDLHVRGGKCDVLRTRRLGADQADVPHTLWRVISQLPGRFVGHVRNLHAQALRHGVRHVWRHPLRGAVVPTSGDEQKIGRIDPSTQNTGRCEFGA